MVLLPDRSVLSRRNLLGFCIQQGSVLRTTISCALPVADTQSDPEPDDECSNYEGTDLRSSDDSVSNQEPDGTTNKVPHERMPV
jgi:hypothetical protein